MTQSENSVWSYHTSMLKTDSVVIVGAASGIGLVTYAAATLHGFKAPFSAVAQSAGLSIVLMSVVSASCREILRRRQSTKGTPLAERFPIRAFLATALASLFLTTALTRTHLESGVAIYQGRQYLEAGEYQAAAESFSRVIELAPERAKGYCLRGLAKFRAGQTEQAYDDLQFALKLQPENRTAQTLFMATLDQMNTSTEPNVDDELAN